MAVMVGRSDNRKMAELFHDLALAMEIQGERWRANSYLRASRVIEALTENLRSISERGDLRRIEGIGESIASKVEEYLSTGHIKALEELRELLPEDLELLRDIPSLGTRRLADLDVLLGVRSVDDLLRAAHEGLLSDLPEFDEEVERRTMEYFTWRREEVAEIPAPLALCSARRIADDLRAAPGLELLELTGPLRRRVPTVANIMLLFYAQDPAGIIARFGLCPEVTELLMVDRDQALGRTVSGAVCMLRSVPRDTFGLELLRSTGPEEYVRGVEAQMREAGIRFGPHRRAITESDIFNQLHIHSTRPVSRGLPAPRTAPGDLQGDLHVISTSLDGGMRVLDMAAAARDMGHRHVCFCDRLGGRRMDVHALEQRDMLIDETIDILGFEILKGGEVDITPDGRLDFPSAPLEDLDLVIASVNTSLTMDHAAMTYRVLKAMGDPSMDVLGHPTSRIVGLREGIQIDLKDIALHAADARIALEMSVRPDRMDLDPATVRSLDTCPFLMLGTEATQPGDLACWDWAVLAAEASGLPSERFLNAIPVDLLRGRRWRG